MCDAAWTARQTYNIRKWNLWLDDSPGKLHDLFAERPLVTAKHSGRTKENTEGTFTDSDAVWRLKKLGGTLNAKHDLIVAASRMSHPS